MSVNNGNQTPILPQQVHNVSIGAKARNAMPLRTPNQDFRANQPRFGMPLGEPYEPRQGRPNMDAFVNLIEGQRLGGFQARPQPNFGAHFKAPREEPSLARRFQGQPGPFPPVAPHAAPPRHANHFGERRGVQWDQDDYDEG